MPWPAASLASSGISPFNSDLGALVLEEGGAGRTEQAGEFRPGIGFAHVDDPHRLDPRLGRLDAEGRGSSPVSTQRQNLRSAVNRKC